MAFTEFTGRKKGAVSGWNLGRERIWGDSWIWRLSLPSTDHLQSSASRAGTLALWDAELGCDSPRWLLLLLPYAGCTFLPSKPLSTYFTCYFSAWPYVCHVHAGAPGSSERQFIHWSSSSSWLGTTAWVLGTKPSSSARSKCS